MQPNYILAVCLQTYHDEDDLELFLEGNIQESEIRTYEKGKTYYVVEDLYDKDYYREVSPKVYAITKDNYEYFK